MPRVLTIAGSDSGGGAGIQADLKTITVLGAYGLCVVTALTAQNTVGVQAVFAPPPEFVAAQLEAVLSDIGADAAKTGMLGEAGVVSVVAAKVREYQVPNLVVDPVMVAKSGDRLLAREAEGVLIRELLPLADLVTPNLPEAAVLAGREVVSFEDMAEAARAILALGPKAVLVKGGHASGPARDLLYDGEEIREYTAPRIETPHTHGTGCTYSAAIAAFLAQGHGLAEAVARAKEFITAALRQARPLGRGRGPANHFALLERSAVLESLREAFETLGRSRAGALVPEVQINLGYALPGAATGEDVAAFPGRIVRLGEGVAAAAGPCFGASRHVAQVILTAMKTDPRARAAMNIRYDPAFLDRARDKGLRVEGFDRAEEPAEVKAREGSSLEWGTALVLERTGRVPDLIFDQGEVGKEPMIRVLGPDPRAVVAKALSLLPGD